MAVQASSPAPDSSPDSSRAARLLRLSALRSSLPEGTIPVAAALLIAGIATYVFFIVGQRAVGGKDAFRPLNSLWFATFALAPGFFLPLEQELGRAIGHRRALGQGGRPVALKVAKLGLLLGGIVAISIIALGPLLATEYFAGNWVMVAALVLAFCSYAPAHLARGVCAGSGRFRHYAVIMGTDGVVRLGLCFVLFGIGIQAIGWYGVAIAISPLLGLAYVARKGGLHTEPGPDADWKEVTPNLGWLLLGSVFAAGLLNAGPVLTSVLAPTGVDETTGIDWDERVTEFGYGVLLARVPLFMFQAVQAALLPRLSRLAASGNLDEFRAGLKRLLTLVFGVGLIGTVGALGLGPFVLERMYDTRLAGATLAILACASAVYMAALALAQAVIALKGHKLVGIGWAIGAAALLVGTLLGGDDVFRRVEIGLLASSISAATFFAFALRMRLRAGVRPDDDSVIEAFTDMPVET